MKRLLLILLLASAGKAEAQKIYFSDTTNQWWGYHWAAFDPHGYYYVSGGYFNPNGSRDTIINNVKYLHLFYGMELGIREDKTAGKIYFRFLSTFRFIGNGMVTDTAEHLFFDYNFKVGDQFEVKWGNYYTRHRVSSIGSVMMGSTYYKTWRMDPDSTTLGGGGVPGGQTYTFIEGIGSTHTPVSSVCLFEFESGYVITCFKNNGWRPGINPAIGSFDNYNSCNYVLPTGIEGIAAGFVPAVFPNPGGNESILKLAVAITHAELLINDGIGRTVAKIPSDNKTVIPIGSYLSMPGNYYYTLRDLTTGQRYTGQFSFR